MQNEVSNLEFLLAEWDSKFLLPEPAETDRDALPTEFVSNSKYTTPLLSNTHPDFAASLEPLIRGFAISIINQLSCVTTSSCGGHYELDNKVICGQHLDILPRNESEFRHILEKLLSASSKIDDPEHARLRIREQVMKADNSEHTLISIEIVPLGGKWDLFLGDAQKLQQALLKELQRCRTLHNSY